MGINHYFSWSSFEGVQLILASITMVIVSILYMWISIIDIKYKEIKAWKILIAVSINFLLPIVYLLSYGAQCMVKFLIFSFIVWFILSFLTGRFNTETVFGQADIDIFISQTIISISIILWAINVFEPIVRPFIILSFLDSIFKAYLVGLVGLLLFWSIKFINSKILKRVELDSEDYRKVPILPSFIPVVILNMYVILAL